MSNLEIELTIDRSRCVLCGEPNECVLARNDGKESNQPCWCVGESFPAPLLALANAKDGGDRCICRRCVEENRQQRVED